jgi:hypothetical protein
MTGLVLLSGFMMILSLGGGMMLVIKPESPWYIQALAFVSPFRYGNELMLNVLLEGSPVKDRVLGELNFNWGMSRCFSILAAGTLINFLVGWLILVIKSRR